MSSTRQSYGQTALTFVFLAASLAVWGLWQSQSLRILSVASNSMAPLISKGDAVVVRPVKPADIRPGDIVSYQSAEKGIIITHRVVAVLPESNRLLTQGDANATADDTVEAAAVIGKVSNAVPGAGQLIDGLRSWPGVVLAVYVPAGLILVHEFQRLARSYLGPTYQLHT